MEEEWVGSSGGRQRERETGSFKKRGGKVPNFFSEAEEMLLR